MRVTMLGHATLLIETHDLVILTDPVLREPFMDEMCDIFPPRELSLSALPDIDLVYVSHRHHDHFEAGSLAILADRVSTVLCPEDPLIQGTLAELGFDEVHPVRDRMEIEMGDTSLLVTPSKLDVPEHGLLVSDPEGRAWNQVDTIFDLEWMGLLGLDERPIDLHLANFEPVISLEPITNESTAFPAALYHEGFEVVRQVGARLVVPASVGMRFRPPFDWLNHFWFPVSHEQFAADVRGLGMACELMRPGDTVEILGGQPTLHPQARPELVRSSPIDPAVLRYWPTHARPPVHAEDLDGVTHADLRASTAAVLERVDQRLVAGVLGSFADLLRRWGVVMEICVVYPEGPQRWSIDFRTGSPRVERSRTHGNYVVEISASGLHALHRGRWWDRTILAAMRSFDSVYRVTDVGVLGLSRLAQGRIRDQTLPSPHATFIHLWDPEQAPWVRHQAGSNPPLGPRR